MVSEGGLLPAAIIHIPSLISGYRLCPGKHLAVEIMFTVVASLLAVFDITKAKRECGEEITPIEEYSKGSIV